MRTVSQRCVHRVAAGSRKQERKGDNQEQKRQFSLFERFPGMCNQYNDREMPYKEERRRPGQQPDCEQ
jgi:hypothetical protein